MIRLIKTATFYFFCISATILSVSLLFIIIGVILFKGISSINIEFLTATSTDFGKSGGILYQTVGTLILITGAGFLSLPIALGTAIYHTEYLALSFRRVASIVIYALNGVPTIIFGLFGYVFFGLYLNIGVSWFTGSIILAIMILPTLTVSIKEGILSIPKKYREAGLALGFTKWKLIRVILIPHSLSAIITGLLLGLCRAAGETAAIMFTATTFSGVKIPLSFNEPVTTLQTHILVLAQEAIDPQTRSNVWGAALVLVTIIFIISITSMYMRSRLKLESQR